MKGYIEIYRIISGPYEGRYKVKAFNPDDSLRGTIPAVYRYRWVARWFGAADAKKLLKQPLYPPVGYLRASQSVFVRRIDL